MSDQEKQPTIHEALHIAYGLHKKKLSVHSESEPATILTLAEANLQAAYVISNAIDRLTKAIQEKKA